MMPSSSMKKSERSSAAIRENLGSLIFETPRKGVFFDGGYFKIDTSKFSYDKIEFSPSPMKQ
jgi:hypothetical protein